MENASKALLMAGGVLIALLVLILLIRSFGNVVFFQKVQLSEEEQAQLVKYNEQYTKYVGQYVYGTEVITLVNKSVNTGAITVNVNFLDDYEFTIPVYRNGVKTTKTIKIKSGKDIDLTQYIRDNDVQTIEVNDNETIIGGLKNKAFKCTKVEYDSTTGKVKSISFEEKKWGNLN